MLIQSRAVVHLFVSCVPDVNIWCKIFKVTARRHIYFCIWSLQEFSERVLHILTSRWRQSMCVFPSSGSLHRLALLMKCTRSVHKVKLIKLCRASFISLTGFCHYIWFEEVYYIWPLKICPSVICLMLIAHQLLFHYGGQTLAVWHVSVTHLKR